jgi:hypothetical protein
MTYGMANKKLEVEIRTRGYRIILDVPERTVRLVKIKTQPDWQISLRCKEGRCAIC